MNLSTKQKQTHRHRGQTCGCQVVVGGGIGWEFGVGRCKLLHLEWINRASLVAQWLRIRLPMRGTWVRALAQEDLTCRGGTKPVRHNY